MFFDTASSGSESRRALSADDHMDIAQHTDVYIYTIDFTRSAAFLAGGWLDVEYYLVRLRLTANPPHYLDGF